MDSAADLVTQKFLKRPADLVPQLPPDEMKYLMHQNATQLAGLFE
jgi:hypothetical protein